MDYKNCKKGVYHWFIVKSSPYTGSSLKQVEKCKFCGETKTYSFLPNGKMKEEREYFLDHIRAFAQPIQEDSGMLEAFKFCNPKAAKRLEQQRIEGRAHEFFKQEMSEKFKWAMKRALNNEGWTDKGDQDGINRSSSEK